MRVQYEYSEDTNFKYRRYFEDYPHIYADGDSLEEANAAFKAMMQDLAVATIEKGWIKLTASVVLERKTNDDEYYR